MVRNSEDYPTIVAQTGPLSGHRWFIKESLTVGREPDCDIVIPSRQVSRYHARFIYSSDGTELEDLGSKNGTNCNGKSIHEKVQLKDGDVILLALAQQFIYLSSDATLPLEGLFPETMGEEPPRIIIDKPSRRVWIRDQELIPPLSVSQFQLLEILYDNQGQVVTRVNIIETVWGEKDAIGVTEQALDALVRRLRDRLAAVDPIYPFIVTVRGHGLRLDNTPIKSQ
jgi:hypothetical protein